MSMEKYTFDRSKIPEGWVEVSTAGQVGFAKYQSGDLISRKETGWTARLLCWVWPIGARTIKDARACVNVLRGLGVRLLKKNTLDRDYVRVLEYEQVGGDDRARLTIVSTGVLTTIDSAFAVAYSEGLTPDGGMEVWELVQRILKSRGAECKYFPQD